MAISLLIGDLNICSASIAAGRQFSGSGRHRTGWFTATRNNVIAIASASFVAATAAPAAPAAPPDALALTPPAFDSNQIEITIEFSRLRS